MKCGDLLISIGITPNLRGFEYICMGVEILSTDSKVTLQSIYKKIAEEKSTTIPSAERTIRHAISKADRDSEWWQKNIGKDRAINSEFLSILAYRMKEGEQHD